MTDASNNDHQPAEGVPAQAEEQIPAQDHNTDEPEYVVEVEGSQQDEPNNGSMDFDQAKAAWKEERQKRKKKNEELEKQRLENEQLRKKIESLESSVAGIQRGPRPDPDDYIGDQQGFYDALDAWNKTGSTQAPAPEAKPDTPPVNQLTDDQAFHAHHSREELKKAIPDYDKAEEGFKRFAESRGINPDAAINSVIQTSYAFEIDYAKAMFAMETDPRLRDRAADATDQATLARVLREAAKKVTVRKNKPIDTQPEPSVRQGAVKRSDGMENFGHFED